jgi:glutamate synthase (NADPH/NADH) small chain
MNNRQPDNMQEPKERIKNFNEVSLGYTYEQAVEEAKRCLNCKNRPCVASCPVSIQIPDFLKLVSEGKIDEADKVIKHSSCLPAVCGRVCPQETQCEGSCIRGIKGEPVAIGKIERFVSDYCNLY